jgi:cytochrome P450 family 9
MTTRFANDVIASCAFGLKVDSMADEKNKFYFMGKKASTFGFVQLLLFFGMTNFPNIAKVWDL